MASESGRLWIRRLLTVAFLTALVLPVIRDEDGLPFSTYPMYAGTRSNEILIVSAIGITQAGETSALSIPTIADTRDPLIAQSYLNDAVRRGDTETVCAVIAGRSSGLASIEIATERHDAVKRVRGEDSLIDRQLHSQCEVAT